MRKNRRPIVIASRRSPLAQAQARGVGQALAGAQPGLAVDYRWIESEGDQRPEVSLADAGGKGLFARAVEQAVLRCQADVAVHSIKDLPAGQETSGLVIAAVPMRADVRDCLISRHAKTLEQLSHGATVGTASPRRAAQVKRLRPDLQVHVIRGNVQTRIRKVLTECRFDATLLAVAGLRRAGLVEYAQHPIDTTTVLTAAGQGALAIQCRMADHVTLTRCLPLNDPWSSAAVHAERQIVAALGGDCHSPIAVLVQQKAKGCTGGGTQCRVRARVLSPDGRICLEADRTGPARHLTRLAVDVVAQLRRSGCQQVLKPPP